MEWNETKVERLGVVYMILSTSRENEDGNKKMGGEKMSERKRKADEGICSCLTELTRRLAKRILHCSGDVWQRGGKGHFSTSSNGWAS